MKLLAYLLALIAFLHLSRGISVQEVRFSTDTIWLQSSPAYVLCEVNVEEGENVTQVKWYQDRELVYHWFDNETIMVSGQLIDRVELPSNRSDWNVKINRVSMDLEGKYTCEAFNDDGEAASNSFSFVIFYNAMPTYEVKLEQCGLNLSLDLPSVYPKPLLLRCFLMDFNEYSFVLNGSSETRANDNGSFSYTFTSVDQLSDHPQGCFVQCSNVVYGSDVELFFHQPELPITCSELPRPSENYSLDTSSDLVAGCHLDFQINSRALYACEFDSSLKVQTTCNDFGEWDPPLVDVEEWPVCINRGTALGVRGISPLALSSRFPIFILYVYYNKL